MNGTVIRKCFSELLYIRRVSASVAADTDKAIVVFLLEPRTLDKSRAHPIA